MIIQKFIDREEDLRFLDDEFRGEKPSFVPIYGRRRIGKTELIKRFIKDKPHIYFLADRVNEKEQLKRLSEIVAESFNDEILRINPFSNWELFFRYIAEKSMNKRIILVIDEFPYMVSSNKAISSIFQRGWDEFLRNTKIFLILSGSSVGMMEREVLLYKAPLYGRRTGQIKLDALKFKHMRGFFPEYDIGEQIEAYAILGGIPAYLLEFDAKKKILENIKERILNPRKPLYDEPEFLLKEELREPRNYFTILSAIASGKTKINDMVMVSNMERNEVIRYLSNLIQLGIIEKKLPVTEKHPHKARKGLYFLKDRLFEFWFKFILPNRSYIEIGEIERVLLAIKKELNSFVSFAFEDICKEFLMELNKQEKLPFKFTKIGKWWYKDNEIDIIALNEETKEILFCECKWQDKKTGMNALEGLQEKSKLVEWNNVNRKEYFVLFSKSGFNENLYSRDLLLFDLKDIDKALL